MNRIVNHTCYISNSAVTFMQSVFLVGPMLGIAGCSG
uniref:Uncharacterized protein n=1 Tax=Anguilla anguilla TaxID=7936 RepID=A0A0E9RW96_ANGAN